MQSLSVYKLPVKRVVVPEGRRAINKEALEKLSASLDSIGLQNPIIVKRSQDEDGVQTDTLVAGRHRLEAAKRLGWELIDAIVKHANRFSKLEAEMCEIAENLHRAELTQQERSEQIARWVALSKRLKAADNRPPSGGQQPHEAGQRAAARELGLSRDTVQRAIKVNSLSDEAKAAAVKFGLNNNARAMAEASKEPTPEAQVHYLRTRAEKPQRPASDPLNDIEAEERQVAALMVAWNKAGQKARETFLSRIETPVMGRQWA